MSRSAIAAILLAFFALWVALSTFRAPSPSESEGYGSAAPETVNHTDAGTHKGPGILPSRP